MKNFFSFPMSLLLHLCAASLLYAQLFRYLHHIEPVSIWHFLHRPLFLSLVTAGIFCLLLLVRRFYFVREVISWMVVIVILQTAIHFGWRSLWIVLPLLALVEMAIRLYQRLRPESSVSINRRVHEKWLDRHFSNLSGKFLSGTRLRRATATQPNLRPMAAPHDVQESVPTAAYHFDELVSHPRFNFSQIVGMTETKQRLLLAGQDIVSGSGSSARNGILLFGSPGNGKTMFAEALAGELGVPLFSLDYGSVASKWVNETPQKVKAAFAQAITLGRGVFFIDEFDAFVKSRDGAFHMDRDLTNVLLTEIVRLRSTRVVLVAATNSLSSLDSAAIREGRFDYKIEVPAPDLPARKAILRRSVGEAMGFHVLPVPLLNALAARWEGFSAARLAVIGRELADMRRDGSIGEGQLTLDTAMRAMRRIQGSVGKLPENVKSIDEIIMPDASRKQLHDLAFRLQHAFRLEQLGGSVSRGVLFYGPPGTGKTQAAMALAAESGYAFLKTTGAELLGSPAVWDRLVAEAKNLRPAILFIDEADDVLRDRRMSGVSPVTNRILSSLDGADGRLPGVLFIAATNHAYLLDGAALRGGRLELKIRFDVPSHARLAIYIRARLNGMASDTFVISRGACEYLIGALRGSTIADTDAALQRIIDEAALRYLREQTTAINEEDVRASLMA